MSFLETLRSASKCHNVRSIPNGFEIRAPMTAKNAADLRADCRNRDVHRRAGKFQQGCRTGPGPWRASEFDEQTSKRSGKPEAIGVELL
jgi:hypothetical protein